MFGPFRQSEIQMKKKTTLSKKLSNAIPKTVNIQFLIEVQPRKTHQLIHYIAVLLLDIPLGHQYFLKIPLLSDPALITARKGRCPSVWMIHLLHKCPLPRSVWQEHQRSLGPEF